MRALVKKKFKNHQRQQTPQDGTHRMRLGGNTEKRRILKAKVLQYCSTAREKESGIGSWT
jgi:hypothetical protein